MNSLAKKRAIHQARMAAILERKKAKRAAELDGWPMTSIITRSSLPARGWIRVNSTQSDGGWLLRPW